MAIRAMWISQAKIERPDKRTLIPFAKFTDISLVWRLHIPQALFGIKT
jgi:hypothetical protein